MPYYIQNERFYLRAPSSAVAMAVTIRGLDSSEALQSAILRAVAHHELLSCRMLLHDDGQLEAVPQSGYSYKLTSIDVHDSSDMPRIGSYSMCTGRLDEWRRVYPEQLRIPFALEAGELLRFFEFRYASSNQRQLLILAHHIAVDGTALMYLIRDIMNNLSNPGLESEVLPIKLYDMKSMPDGVRLPWQLRIGMKLTASKWSSVNRIFEQREYEQMCAHYWNDTHINLVQRVLEPEVTCKLARECKQRGLTVNTALAAALAQAVRDERACDIGMAASIRPAGYEGMGLYATGISVKFAYSPMQGFWQNVRDLHKLVHAKLDDPSKKLFLLNLLASVPPTLIDASYFAALAAYDNAVARRMADMFGYTGRPKSISLTNLTRAPIPHEYGEYSIADLIFVPPLVINARRMLGVVTLNDQLVITLQTRASDKEVFPEAFIDNALALLRCGG